ncbi:MAG TPA: DUF4886 domain-containing protein [Burkholderiales bacterium]|nr:DUF4886 domain-containing protein [Burkholderiales bacterium]
MRFPWLVALALIAATACAADKPRITQPLDTPTRILFVGHSYLYYNNSLHNHLRRLAIADDPSLAKRLQYRSATIGGAPLWYHDIDHLTDPAKLGMKQPFEVVILVENSTSALSENGRAKFRETAAEFSAVISQRGGRTALYMTHAHVKPSRFASPDMVRKVEDMYISVGNEVGALVIPVALAFEEAYRQRPDIRLHQDYDGSHPELIGTYLAACVVYASVYGKSPLGNSYDYHGRIDKDTTAFLQKIADDTVRKFFGR